MANDSRHIDHNGLHSYYEFVKYRVMTRPLPSVVDTAMAPTELRRSITRMGRLLSAGMPKGELTPMKLAALGILRRSGPMSASALAVRLGIRPQSLTRILADLEETELLTRKRDPADAREHRLETTAKALRLMRAEGERRDRAIREVMQRELTPLEIDLLLLAARVLDKLADGWTGQKAAKQSAAPDDDDHARGPPASQRLAGRAEEAVLTSARALRIGKRTRSRAG